ADALGREEVQRALAEDRATEDVTTRLLGSAARQPAGAAFVAEGRFVIAGLPIVARVYSALERDACFEPGGADGEWVAAGTVLARVGAPAGVPIVVEVEDEAQFGRALAAGVRHILADNQGPQRVAAWVRRAGPGVTIQASGGITPETARAYAEAGAALISIGALTHSAPAAPIRCDITHAGSTPPR